MGDPTALVLIAIAGAGAWAAAALATLRLGRTAVARLPVDVREDPEYREESDAVKRARISDAFQSWERSSWLWMIGVVTAAFVFAALDFTLLFFVLWWTTVVIYLWVPSTRERWAQRIGASDRLGSPTKRTMVWHGAFSALDLVMTVSWTASLVCLAAALAEALDL